MSDERHPCVHPDCGETVAYDDEPWCFTHSPDSGSCIMGYSFKEKPDTVAVTVADLNL